MKRYTIPFFIFCAWFYVFKMTPIRFHSGEDDYIVTCGVTDPPRNNASPDASKGKIAFDANCARCHNAQLEKKELPLHCSA